LCSRYLQELMGTFSLCHITSGREENALISYGIL